MVHTHLPTLIDESVARYAELPALRVQRAGAWQTTSYGEMGERVGRLAAGLVAHGLQPGERVAIYAGNRPEWTLTDLAALRAGCVPVTIYATSTVDQVRFVLQDSGASALVVGTAIDAERVRPLLAEFPDLRLVLSMDEDVPEITGVTALADDPEAAGPEHFAEIDRRLSLIRSDDVLTIVYTSGTTGEPKGVCLTHRNVISAIEAIRQRFDVRPGQRSMCFLPLSHAFERAWVYVVLANGMENVYVTDPRTVADAMVQIQPDAFCSVPRLYEKVYSVAHEQAGTGATRKIFDTCLAIGLDVQTRIQQGRRVPLHLQLAHAVADRLVLHRVRDAVGGPKSVMACGGAPIRPEVVRFFLAAGLGVYEGYGLTETAPMVSCNSPGQTRIGSVGRPVPACEVRIAEDGEIQVRGDNIFAGYWNRPELTAEAFDDGWFRTGDVGHLDEDGYLYITDRIKDLIITAQGKNIAPAPLEVSLASNPLIDSAVVVGDNQKYLVALLAPDFAALKARAAEEGWTFTDHTSLVSLPQVQQLYQELVHTSGEGLASYEQIQKFRLLDKELTMDSGDLTPTLKVRRRTVSERFAHLVEEMYSEGDVRGRA